MIIFVAGNSFLSSINLHKEFLSSCECHSLVPPKIITEPVTRGCNRTVFTSYRTKEQSSIDSIEQDGVSISHDSIHSILRSTIPSYNVKDFVHVTGGVIVSKIHGMDHWNHLMQSLCLLTVAYNQRTNYDIVIFVTEKIAQPEIDAMKKLVSPAKLTVVVDRQTLQQQIADMTPNQVSILLGRCHVNSTAELTWETRCTESESHSASLKYLWQAEFRAKHLWYQEVLKPYKYMMWFDSDAMPMQVWHQDPMATMARHELVILYANFPWGMSQGEDFFRRIKAVFNVNLCTINFDDQKGIMKPGYSTKYDGSCSRYAYSQVHGFFHLTNLDFYRSTLPFQWASTLIGDTKFSRRYDDQIGVTVPPAILAPHKAWDMKKHGLNLNVMHNGNVNGRAPNIDGWYLSYWKNNRTSHFPEAIDKCSAFIKVPGR